MTASLKSGKNLLKRTKIWTFEVQTFEDLRIFFVKKPKNLGFYNPFLVFIQPWL